MALRAAVLLVLAAAASAKVKKTPSCKQSWLRAIESGDTTRVKNVISHGCDVEFQINAEENTIQIRSASRTGYSDLGANRTRVELIRAAFESTTTHRP